MTRRGYTLVELVIVLGILSMMFIAFVALYLRFGTSIAIQSASVEVSYSASRTVSEFERLARQAQAVVSSHTFSGTSYTTGSTTVILMLPAISASGDIVSGSYDYALIHTASSTVYEIVSPDAASARHGISRTLSTSLGNLTFTYDAGDPAQATAVSLDITTAAVLKEETVGTRLTSTAKLRNRL